MNPTSTSLSSSPAVLPMASSFDILRTVYAKVQPLSDYLNLSSIPEYHTSAYRQQYDNIYVGIRSSALYFPYLLSSSSVGAKFWYQYFQSIPEYAPLLASFSSSFPSPPSHNPTNTATIALSPATSPPTSPQRSSSSVQYTLHHLFPTLPSTQRETLQMTIAYLLSEQSDNLLCKGYRRKSHQTMQTNSVFFGTDIENYCMNNHIDYVCRTLWRELFKWIGNVSMIQLFINPSLALFEVIHVTNNTILQISGVPINVDIDRLRVAVTTIAPSSSPSILTHPSIDPHPPQPQDNPYSTSTVDRTNHTSSSPLIYYRKRKRSASDSSFALPSPPVVRSATPVKGRWLLPRSHMFYGITYNRHPGLPSTHIIHQLLRNYKQQVLSSRQKQKDQTQPSSSASSPSPLSISGNTARKFIHYVFILHDHIQQLASVQKGALRTTGPSVGSAVPTFSIAVTNPHRHEKKSLPTSKILSSLLLKKSLTLPTSSEVASLSTDIPSVNPSTTTNLPGNSGSNTPSGVSIANIGPFATPVPPVVPTVVSLSTTIPNGLVSLVPLIQELLQRCLYVKVNKLLNKHCPVPEMVSTNSSILPYASSHTQVMAFLRAYLEAILPKPLWGGNYNKRKLLGNLSVWVTMGLRDIMRVTDFFTGIRTSDYECFASGPLPSPASATAQSTKPRCRDGKTQTRYVHTWLIWLLLHLIVPLLRSCFYITNGEVDHLKLLYFRKPTWISAINKAFDDLRKRITLQPITMDETNKLMSDRNRERMGWAKVRFIPKQSGLRPIMNLAVSSMDWPKWSATKDTKDSAASSIAQTNSRASSSLSLPLGRTLPPSSNLAFLRSSMKNAWTEKNARTPVYTNLRPPERSINQLLVPLHEILKYERSRNNEIAGSSVFGFDGAYIAMRRFAAIRQIQSTLSNDDPSIASATAASVISHPGNRYPLHVVTADIRSAYDSILQNKLLDIVEPLLQEEAYSIRTYVTISSVKQITKDRNADHNSTASSSITLSDLWVRRRKHAFPSTAAPAFTTWAQDLTKHNRFRNMILCDLVNLQTVRRKDAVGLLRAHIRNHLVYLENFSKNNTGMYVQGTGIPQGSLLSSLLCNIYFGAMETRYLLPRLGASIRTNESSAESPNTGVDDYPGSSFVSSFGTSVSRTDHRSSTIGSTLLMRLTDDFCIISEDQQVSRTFANMIHAGVPEYGAIVNVQKTESSFSFRTTTTATDSTVTLHQIPSVPPSQPHPSSSSSAHPLSPIEESRSVPKVAWCGLRINSQTGEVQADNSRYFGKGGIMESISISFSPSPRTALSRMLRSFLRPKCHAILLDGHINSLSTVALNVYELTIIAASKLLGVLRHFGHATNHSLRSTVLVDIVTEAVEYLQALIKTRCPGKSRNETALLSLTDTFRSVPTPRNGGQPFILGPASVRTLDSFVPSDFTNDNGTENNNPSIALTHPLTGLSRPIGWCPLSRIEIAWIGYTAFARVFARSTANLLIGNVSSRLLAVRSNLLQAPSTSIANPTGFGTNVPSSIPRKYIRTLVRRATEPYDGDLLSQLSMTR